MSAEIVGVEKQQKVNEDSIRKTQDSTMSAAEKATNKKTTDSKNPTIGETDVIDSKNPTIGEVDVIDAITSSKACSKDKESDKIDSGNINSAEIVEVKKEQNIEENSVRNAQNSAMSVAEETTIKETPDSQNPTFVKVRDKDDVTSAMAYREDEESDESESSLSSCSEVDEIQDNSERNVKKKTMETFHRTQGEILPQELPPLEDLKISVDETEEMQEVGTVTAAVGVLVVVQGNMEVPALDEETVLFTADRKSFGKVFEVFGPVAKPFYSVRFNSPEDIAERNITSGIQLYCAPKKEEYTQFVFVDKLKKMKGSDASWGNNNEPPSWCRDFSDDEEEKRMKSKRENDSLDSSLEGSVEEPTGKQPHRTYNRQRRNEAMNNKNQGPGQHRKQNWNRRGRGQGQGQGQSWPPTQMDNCPPPPSFASSCNIPWRFGNAVPPQFNATRGMNQNRKRGQFRHTSPRGHPLQGQRHIKDEPNNYNGPMQVPPSTNQIMDTRFIQNCNQGPGVPPRFRMDGPRSTFGGQPQFSAGPMNNRFRFQRPANRGTPRFSSGPPGNGINP